MDLFPKSKALPRQTEHPHVVLEDDVAYVKGTCVPVRRIWFFHRRGTPIATLIARYPNLGPAAVLSALAFAYDHQPLIEADMARAGMLPSDP